MHHFDSKYEVERRINSITTNEKEIYILEKNYLLDYFELFQY